MRKSVREELQADFSIQGIAELAEALCSAAEEIGAELENLVATFEASSPRNLSHTDQASLDRVRETRTATKQVRLKLKEFLFRSRHASATLTLDDPKEEMRGLEVRA